MGPSCQQPYPGGGSLNSPLGKTDPLGDMRYLVPDSNHRSERSERRFRADRLSALCLRLRVQTRLCWIRRRWRGVPRAGGVSLVRASACRRDATRAEIKMRPSGCGSSCGRGHHGVACGDALKRTRRPALPRLTSPASWFWASFGPGSYVVPSVLDAIADPRNSDVARRLVRVFPTRSGS